MATIIGTHNGHFHADEALAVHMLRKLPAYSQSALVRTRDPDMLAACHTVVDVGGQYDPVLRRFDHHQRGFDTTFPGRTTKLSSAGLVYLHFGRDIIAESLYQITPSRPCDEKADADIDLVWRKVYEGFIEPLDANDNGIAQYDPDAVAAAGLEPRFNASAIGLASAVARRNASWNDVQPEDRDKCRSQEDARFVKASVFIGQEFDRYVDQRIQSWLPALLVVRKAYSSRNLYDPSGRLLVLESSGVPWKEHLFSLEALDTDGTAPQVLYVLYAETATIGSRWRIQAVPVSLDSFESRKPLPSPWRGLRDHELDQVLGRDLTGAVFVHAGGFTGGHSTYEGVREMARQALDYNGPTK